MERGFPWPHLVAALILVPVIATSGPAAEPLHRQIDRAIETKLGGDAAALSTDAKYVRRIYLDLAGLIPTSSEARIP
jgi:hypothetical protein